MDASVKPAFPDFLTAFRKTIEFTVLPKVKIALVRSLKGDLFRLQGQEGSDI